jgi:O-antigen ligase
MLLIPPAVGLAASTYTVDTWQVRRFIRVCKVGAILFCAFCLLTYGVPSFKGQWYLGAGLHMTAVLLCCLFAVLYSHGDGKALLLWTAMALLPAWGIGRGTSPAAALTLPLTPGPLGWTKRVLIGMAVSAFGVFLFYTEGFQKEWFSSGRGELSDLKLDNPDLTTSGRLQTWELMINDIRRRPWFGHGANANQHAIFQWQGSYAHPHNDYLRLLYDYGVLGTSIFLCAVLAQCIHALRKARGAPEEARLLLETGALAFIPMLLVMVGDNIVLYASFFGSLHFTILGLGYAAAREASRGRSAHSPRAGAVRHQVPRPLRGGSRK